MPNPLKNKGVSDSAPVAANGTKKTHPMYEKAYNAYQAAKGRCTNPNHKDYPSYGAKGVQFLYNSLAEMIEDIGLPKDKSVSLDRIDPHSHYAPTNCRWASKAVQAVNKKGFKGASVLTLSEIVEHHKKQTTATDQQLVTDLWFQFQLALTRPGIPLELVNAAVKAKLNRRVFRANWILGQVADGASPPGEFHLPSLTKLGDVIRLRGGPFYSGPFKNNGLFRGLKNYPINLNVPQLVRSWLSVDLSSGGSHGAAWVGYPTPSVLICGGVEGWMLHVASRIAFIHDVEVRFRPLTRLNAELHEMGHESSWSTSDPLLVCEFLFIPDLCLDPSPPDAINGLEAHRIAALLRRRRELGRRTFVGVQNPNKVPKLIAQEVFAHFNVYELSDIPSGQLVPAAVKKLGGEVLNLPNGLLGFKEADLLFQTLVEP